MKVNRARKMKIKEFTASLLSLSVAGFKKESSNYPELITLSKKVIEKTNFLVKQHHEFVDKSQKQFYTMSGANIDKLCELYELLSVHDMLIGGL